MDKHKKVWAHGFANEIGQLFQGIRNAPGNDACFFIPKSLVPAHKRPTYGRICCNYQPQKEEKHCIRLTIGSNWIDYPGNKNTPMADLTTDKLLINSTISTPGAKFFGHQPCQFLPQHPLAKPQIHASLSRHHPQQNHCPLQPLRHCHSRGLGLHQDLEGDVWSSPSRHPCISLTQKTCFHQRVLPMPTYTWSLMPRLAKHHVLPSG
jgi:hypothetical protein